MQPVINSFLIFSFLLLTACDDSKIPGGGGGDDEDKGEPGTPTEALLIQGSLAIGDATTNTDVIAEQAVTLKDSTGNTISAGTSDASGAYSLDVPAGSLVIDSTFAESNLNLMAGNSRELVLESTVTDDGSGKAIGIREPINITTDSISGSQEGKSIVNLGEKSFKEIGAITGTVEFDDATAQGADVFIPGKSFFARTGTDGKFHLLYVPAGVHTVRIEKTPFEKEIEVTVEKNKTSNQGTITVAANERNPMSLADALVGTWSTKCYGTSASPDTYATGTITITALNNVSRTGQVCFSGSGSTGTGDNEASREEIDEIFILSDGSIILKRHKVSTSVVHHYLVQVSNYSNDKITIIVGDEVEVLTRQ